MVGVPRSKGCTTCRRRKVACDQAKPHCLTCRRRGVQCEGYAQHPTVLQWTPTGLAPRSRFDEVSSAGSSSENTVNHGILLPLQVNAGGMMLEQIEVRCLETYLPTRGAMLADVKQHWMYSILQIQDLGRTLSLAFSALSLARVGLVHQDQSLVSQSRSQYSLALPSLQEALYTPELAFQDRTLAAMRTLSIYEHLSPTFAPTPPGRVHEDGLAKWCLAAGPQSINTPFAMQIFQDVRWSIMGHSIETRTRSVLGNEDWKTVPWQHYAKDSLQLLFDIGFDLAAALERTDRTTQPQMNPNQINFTELWSGCLTIFGQLENWHRQHWPNQSSRFSPGSIPDSSGEVPNTQSQPQFGSLWEATSIVYYWSFKLVLDQNVLALSELQNRLPASEQQTPPAASSAQTRGKASTTRDASLVSHGLTPAQAEQIASTSFQLATDIVQSAPYFLAPDTGWLGPQRLFFPLRLTMQHFGKLQSPQFGEAKAAFFACIERLRTTCADKTTQ